MSISPKGEAKTGAEADTKADETKEKAVKVEKSSCRDLFRFADSFDWLLIIVGGIFACGAGATQPALMVSFGDMTHMSSSTTKVSEAVEGPVLTLTYIAIGAAITFYMAMWLLPWAANRMTNKLRKAFFEAVLNQDAAFFDSVKPGEMSIIINDAANDFENGLGRKFSEVFQCVFQFVFGFGLAMYYSWTLSLALLAFLPLMGLGFSFMVEAGGGDGVLGKEAYETAGSLATEALAAMRTVASFGGEVSMAKRYADNLGKAQASATRIAGKTAFGMSFAFGIMFVMYGFGFWYGGTVLIGESRVKAVQDYPPPSGFLTNVTDPVWANETSIALLYCKSPIGDKEAYTGEALSSCACDLPWDKIPGAKDPRCGCRHTLDDAIGVGVCYNTGHVLTAFFSLLISGFVLGQLGPAIEALTKARIAMAKIMKVIDRKPEIDPRKSGKAVDVQGMDGRIEFRNVHFSYTDTFTGEVKHPVFAGLNITIEPGQTVAFVGESGSGKSTIGRLVERFYDPQQGSVLLDGTNLSELDVSQLRGAIALVNQEPLLFNTTIRENIAYGLATRAGKDPSTIPIEDIHRAAKAANAHSFIMSGQFPQHYDTVVGARGGKLSGGQKQRIALARAMLRKTKVLILDEATSALDTESEAKVQAALDEASRANQRTTIIIAHRLTTVRNADRIFVLGDGPEGPGHGTVVVESGTHDELMEKAGVYHALVGAQASTGGNSNAEAKAADGNDAPIDGRAKSVSMASSVGDDAAQEADEGKTGSKDGSKAAGDQAGDEEEEEEEEEEKYEVKSSRVWAYNKPDMIWLVLGIISAIGNGLTFPLFAIFLSDILTAFTIYELDTMKAEILKYSAFFYGIAVFCFIVNTGQAFFMAITGERVTTRLRHHLFRAMLRQDISFFDDPKNSIGALSSRLSTDAARIQLTTGASLGATVNALSSVTAGIVIAFTSSWKIALVVMAAMPLMGIAQSLQIKVMTGGEQAVMGELSESVGLVSEMVTGIREVQAFELMPLVMKLYGSKLGIPAKKARKNAMYAGLAMGFAQFVTFAFYALAFWYGATLIDDGEIDFNKFLRAVFGLAFAAAGAGQAAAFAGDQVKAKAATGRIFKLLDRVPSIDAKPWADSDAVYKAPEERPFTDQIIPESEFQGRVTLRNIHFAYPTRQDAPVFSGLDITIEPGQTVAFIGQSGSGKSSIISLMDRFYDPSNAGSEVAEVDVSVAGSKDSKDSDGVFIDGRNLRNLDLKWVRSKIGLVGQEPVLFYGSIHDNIAWGKKNATEAEVIEAAKMANAHEFIQKIGGYSTNVGDRGSKLSGGQKQRIAIARAIIKNPRILLLDEATSALDNESEKIVQASLDSLIAQKDAKRTTLVVAHRLSTIRNADCIFVLENDGTGAVVAEKGTHEELMALEGKYTMLRRAFDGADDE